ncbi:MAG: T9SS type A sorting domain-containing protein [Dysgonamonadaceae bacterium]|jgi:hypothetical protein|nr:T9SS type A sorting domain-containing protein [Dysgonamonadaceae bacterium]
MKRYFLKTVLLTTALFLSNTYINAQCDHQDDFWDSFGEFYSQEDELITSQNGWTAYAENKNVLIGNGEDYDDGVSLISDHVGGLTYLASPVFNDGCKSIRFEYMESCLMETDMKVEIKQNDEIVWDSIVPPFTVGWGGDHIEFFVDNLNIEGEYQLVVYNITEEEYAYLVVKNICLNALNPVVPAHNYQFNVPKDAVVYVGDKDQSVLVAGNYLTKHYVPFTKKDEVYILETDTSRIWYYDLPAPTNAAGGFNYRITREGKAAHVGLFKPKAGTEVEKDTITTFTDDQLSAYGSKTIDHDVAHLNGRNVADMFMNINAQGYLTLPLREDTAFQLIHTRNWQAIDTDVNNYFIEPEFHYTVIDETGLPSSNIITVSDSGVIRPTGAGTAIVLIDYDAIITHHTTNLGLSTDSLAKHGALFSKLWPENTGVFVVAVEQPEANITTNMNLNDFWAQDGTDKTDGIAIDAEHDVMYYDAAKGSFPYTFKPDGATEVLVATPTIGDTITSYKGFTVDSVETNTDGSYTVKLGFGRNIVKLVSATGATYQIITAKPVTYAISNLTNPEKDFAPGDSVSVLFNTLYHPANKMSGIYNMSAGIQYSNAETNFALILGPGQYTFASRAQEYSIRIPEDYTDNEFVLNKGVIKVKGFGSFYGEHRNITIQNGVNPNLNASVREAYFGSIPDVVIPLPGNNVNIQNVPEEKISVYPNPFTDYIIINTGENNSARIFDLSGKTVLTSTLVSGRNQITTSALQKGVYLLKVGEKIVKIVK